MHKLLTYTIPTLSCSFKIGLSEEEAQWVETVEKIINW
jgi:hypothetical protein